MYLSGGRAIIGAAQKQRQMLTCLTGKVTTEANVPVMAGMEGSVFAAVVASARQPSRSSGEMDALSLFAFFIVRPAIKYSSLESRALRPTRPILMPLSLRRSRSLPSAASPIKDKDLRKTVKHAIQRRQLKILNHVSLGKSPRSLARLRSLKHRDIGEPAAADDNQSVLATLFDPLVRPALSVINPAALAYAGLDPVLEDVGPVNVRKYLAHIRSPLFGSILNCTIKPFDQTTGSLPKFISVTLAPGTHRSYFPTHMLAVHSSQASSAKVEIKLYPVHAIVLASHCCYMPPLPPPIGAPKSNDELTHYMPLVPLCVPSVDTLNVIVTFLYTGQISWLVRSLIPAWVETNFIGCQTLDDKVERVVDHLVETCSMDTLIRHLHRIRNFWMNARTLGVVLTCVWDMIDIVWKCYTQALDRPPPLPSSSYRGSLPPPKKRALDDDSELKRQERSRKRPQTRKSTRRYEEAVDEQVAIRAAAAAAATTSSSSATAKSHRKRLADDLLRLSRSSKALRELLMSKSSRIIWRTAEKSIGLPECPKDLSSPQYASFVFDTFCTTWHSSFHDYYYYYPTFKAIYEEYSSFKKSFDAREKYVTERRDMLCQMSTGIIELKEWMQTAKQIKSEIISDAISSRENDIFDKLRKLGYTDNDFYSGIDEKDWKWKILTRQPRKLTDRTWANIRPQLEDTIRLRREKDAMILRNEHIKERQSRLDDLGEDFALSDEGKACCISYLEFRKHPLYQEVAENDDTGTDPTPEQWKLLKQVMLDLSTVHRHKFTIEAASLITRVRKCAGLQGSFASNTSGDSVHGSQYGSVSDAILRHPTSFFEDPNSRKLNALCTFSDLLQKRRENYYSDHPITLKPTALLLSNANGVYNSLGSGVASTMDGMVALDESFICMRCSPLMRKRLSWTGLVGHFYEESILFKSRERYRLDKDTTKNPGFLNIHDHDVENPTQLAVYSSNIKQLAEELIRPCKCKEMGRKCKSRKERQWCSICPKYFEGLGWEDYYFCKEELDDHIQSKHGLPEEQ
ncbi:hypothetical protein EW145_g6411 [Phellinidium pouzarii]|uniref:BTB domain-containing protein n=1 Tax=Phellinidium pouzarii TaxID=167371 RepID=A0A4S4KWN4_9AGAM|nr:hypothetical protein EW145_g6411 [Phellinidium pouzarii]